MKQFTVRKELRTPVRCQFYCFSEGGLISGVVRDLSPTGWRVTVDRPVHIAFEQHVFISMHDGQDCHTLCIESAIVRWTHGREAGWEITGIDELTRTRLTTFLKQCEQEDVALRVREETYPVTCAALV